MHSEPSGPRILAHEIADHIRDLIEGGVYPPGAPLRQEEVARRLRVSRIPVREAFRLLEADSLVSVQANRGTFVAQPDDMEIAELFDLRLLLEQDLLARTVPHLTESVLKRIEWLDDRIASAQTPSEWVRYDEEFHLATYEPAGRPRTLSLVTVLRRSLNAYYLQYLAPKARAADWQSEHRAIRRALRRRDATAAVTALGRHLMATRDALLQSLRLTKKVGRTT